MASLLAKIRSSTSLYYFYLQAWKLISARKQAASPSAGSSTAKKDSNAPPLTPLEKHLLDAGPIRNDGSDKFFGMENVSALDSAAKKATHD
ncbi:MAG: hypothetical protein Q9200_003822 [Gallowayella weberi]